MKEYVEKLAAIAAEASAEADGDFFKDGLLHCGICRTPKQCRIAGYILPCLCQCREEKQREEAAAEKAAKEWRRIQNLPIMALYDNSTSEYTFDAAEPNRNAEQLRRAKKYIEEWEKVRAENAGLLFLGEVGAGKTFLASCIANALREKGVPVIITTAPLLVQGLQDLKQENRVKLINSLSNFELLIIDELGAERSSDYAQEIIYNVIDGRYKAKRPLIVTTNLSLAELKGTADIRYRRIYSRVLEMCAPLKFSGGDIRASAAARKTDRLRELFEA